MNWTVVLEPHIELINTTTGELLPREYIGDPNYPPPSSTVWFTSSGAVDAWFNEYYFSANSFLRTYAQIAQDSNVDILCVGTELQAMTLHYPARWEVLVDAVRQEYDVNLLTYAADWDEYQSVTFWDRLDVMGIDAYFPLDIASSSPLQSELEDAWSTHINAVETFLVSRPGMRVFFTEIGYRATQAMSASR